VLSFSTAANPMFPGYIRVSREDYLAGIDEKTFDGTSVGVWACVCFGSSQSGQHYGGHIDYSSKAFGPMSVADAVAFIDGSGLTPA